MSLVHVEGSCCAADTHLRERHRFESRKRSNPQAIASGFNINDSSQYV